jgi:carbohydrate kinase (thermoresistant glucokinase family)
MAGIIIIMGVSGCGKTTIGKLLASKIGVQFRDGDDFHPESNVIKIKNNVPLNDKDREPWLNSLAMLIKEWSNSDGAILACSALKESYRTQLSKFQGHIDWVFLSGSYETIYKRVENRKYHFMTSTLLQSQFDTLEIPTYGMHLDIEQKQTEIVSEILEKLNING